MATALTWITNPFPIETNRPARLRLAGLSFTRPVPALPHRAHHETLSGQGDMRSLLSLLATVLVAITTTIHARTQQGEVFTAETDAKLAQYYQW